MYQLRKDTIPQYNASAFLRALFSARRGDRIIYFKGDLAFARWQESEKKQRSLANFAKVVYAEYKAGACALVQKKIKTNVYEYMAVKL